ncbi:BbrUII/HgiDII family restriction enzyme [Microbacterium foliorum]|uniref:BbrUII/HgiDII family restriction enzyme n=1 Tax=Microbacterium foliorum TaxID=104336 RepID=UPI001D7BA53E|nr:ATP-binding protein [Microbacterium foliorum]CAH0190608.1 DNA mismatch repair protein MutL [Microbacterium foliorum]CAH0225972.1 DNA mismatch repair protein MutL [Microbacterium foliorum]
MSADAAAPSKYKMEIDLAVLKSLGINLYSNAAAVLSEVVANAWDADATQITIAWTPGGSEIVIEDDGCGMSLEQLNTRFLRVGYAKRDEEGESSNKYKRPFMGQKGIGKLSIFSLAGQVDVYSTDGNESNGFRIRLDKLEESIRGQVPYSPEDLPVPSDLPTTGTRLVLSELKSARSGITATALRKRLARRFDVLRPGSGVHGPFSMIVNGDPIGFKDRDDLKRIQYLWEFGTQELDKANMPKLVDRWVLTDNVVHKELGWKVEGWFGTVETPTDLTDEDDRGESLRNIIVIARRRPIQEGILDKLDFNKIFGNYVTGQIRADFLDVEGYDDIATSDRQRLIEDDPRVELLVEYLASQFSRAADKWGKERPKQKLRELTKEYPTVRAWADSRPSGQRKAAKKLIGTIAAITFDDEQEASRRQLFKAGILAFERVALHQNVKDLKKLGDVDSSQLLAVLATQEALEAQLYLEILQSRLAAIDELEDKIDSNELEKVLQHHLFKHMWLLDPAWEGATGDGDMEKRLKTIAPGAFDPSKKSKDEIKRVDITYRTDAGKHVIVELKRASAKIDIQYLAQQGRAYFDAVYKAAKEVGAANAGVEVIFVLGEEPKGVDRPNSTPAQVIEKDLDSINGRVVYYRHLVRNARKQYQAYVDARSTLSNLDKVLASLDTPTEAADSGSGATSTIQPEAGKSEATAAAGDEISDAFEDADGDDA